VEVIKSVITILVDYGANQRFAAFGFGAIVPQLEGTSHCFPLNLNFDQPKVKGMEVSM